jgi:hypothetical protein
MLVAVWNLIDEPPNELAGRNLQDFDTISLPLVFPGKTGVSRIGGQKPILGRWRPAQVALEPVINFIPLESKKYPRIPLSLTMEGWATRDKSVIPAM